MSQKQKLMYACDLCGYEHDDEVAFIGIAFQMVVSYDDHRRRLERSVSVAGATKHICTNCVLRIAEIKEKGE
jgi:hypothetical protein